MLSSNSDGCKYRQGFEQPGVDRASEDGSAVHDAARRWAGRLRALPLGIVMAPPPPANRPRAALAGRPRTPYRQQARREAGPRIVANIKSASKRDFDLPPKDVSSCR